MVYLSKCLPSYDRLNQTICEKQIGIAIQIVAKIGRDRTSQVLIKVIGKYLPMKRG